jgi:hypothetical protein
VQPLVLVQLWPQQALVQQQVLVQQPAQELGLALKPTFRLVHR